TSSRSRNGPNPGPPFFISVGSATTPPFAIACRGPITGCFPLPTKSARPTVRPTWRWPVPEGPSGSSPPPDFRPCSSRIRTRQRTTRRKTRVSSRSREARSSCRRPSSGGCRRSWRSSWSMCRAARACAARCARSPVRTPRRRARRSWWSLPRLEGRRIWFVGIGGAGLSGYALLARAWGAEVGGWDRVETPYLDSLRGVTIELAPDPGVPEGWAEVVVSTAYRDQAEGKSRADFLAELVSLQRSIVVAGAHGKTTTAAMIAFCLDRLGDDPAFLIGGEVPQLGGNARAGKGWLVVEGDESDRTIAALRQEVAVVTNVDLDHHSEFASRAEVESMFARWLSAAPKAVRGDELQPVELELAVRGEHNRQNAAVALAAVELAGFSRDEAATVLGEFRGVGRRLESRGEAGGVEVIDSYAHHPAEL